MPEIRKDPVIGRWVIISTERRQRPTGFLHQSSVPTKNNFCPFCPGNEDKTPPEILAYRKKNSQPNTPGWTLRTVPNKFPALKIEGDFKREGDGVYDNISGIGAHEVIIESPEHTDTLSSLSDKNFEDLLWAYRDRIVDLKKDSRLRYILIFKNHGEQAGATLEHTHSQLIALPIIPKRVAEELDGSLEYYNFKERCIFCDIIRQEIHQGVRVIDENHDFLAFAPYASISPFETWIIPKLHGASFENATKPQYESLAIIFRNILKRIDKVLNFPPYNFILHSAPFDQAGSEYFHWHFEIMPKLTKVAGFEWGSSFFINPTPPEEAASFLRDAKI
jgi:UDPglucose--hexose-1-phosphate uridylyltransferase